MNSIYNDILPKQSYEDECKLRDGESLPQNITKETLEKLISVNLSDRNDDPFVNEEVLNACY